MCHPSRATPGVPVSLAHRLTNTGNIATACTAQFASLNGDSFDLSDLRLARDANANGAFDAGEAPLEPGTPIFLRPGESADLVLFGTVPSGTAADAISRTRLFATVSGPAPGAVGDGDFSPLSASVVDTLTTAAGASIAVSKSASTAQATPGGEISYSISARNTGTLSPLPQNLQVDGAPRAGFAARQSARQHSVHRYARRPDRRTRALSPRWRRPGCFSHRAARREPGG